MGRSERIPADWDQQSKINESIQLGCALGGETTMGKRTDTAIMPAMT
jgi:hypothetical protein